MNDLDTRLRHMAREEETPVPKDFDENLTRTLAQLPARKRRRIPRAVLLAACLVLVLTGAVLAAESGVFAPVWDPGDPNTEGLFYDGTKYGGTWTYSTDRRAAAGRHSPGQPGGGGADFDGGSAVSGHGGGGRVPGRRRSAPQRPAGGTRARSGVHRSPVRPAGTAGADVYPHCVL